MWEFSGMRMWMRIDVVLISKRNGLFRWGGLFRRIREGDKEKESGLRN